MYAQLLRFLIEQQNGENLVVNGAFYDLRNAAQQLIEVERGIDALLHLNHQGQELRQFQRPRCSTTVFSHGFAAWRSAMRFSAGVRGARWVSFTPPLTWLKG